MKRLWQDLLKTPMALVFVAAVMFYGFPALGTVAEINKYAVVTAIGLDYTEDTVDKYEVSLLTFIPIAEQGFKENFKVISSKGKNLSEAMDYAGLHIGRQVGLSHVKTVVLNENLLAEDVSNEIDFLTRSRNMETSTKIIVTDAPAKEFLSVVQKLDSESSIKITELVNFNKNYIYASFESFFKGKYGPTGVSLVPFLRLKEAETGGLNSSGGSSSSQSSQNKGEGQKSDSQNSQKEIVNDGDTLVFKDGKPITMLTGRDMKKIKLVNGDFETGAISVYNISDGVFDDATLTFDILDKVVQQRVSFKNGIPVISIDMKLTLALTEVRNSKGMVQENVESLKVSEQIVKGVNEKYRKSVAEAINLMKEYQVDIVDFYTLLNNSNVKAFKKFIESIDDKDNYLSHIVYKVAVTPVFK